MFSACKRYCGCTIRATRGRAGWALAVALCAPLGLTGQIQNVQFQGATSTRAIISFDVPDPTNCLVQVSTDPNFVSLVNDTNALLFPGSQNCNRASSSVVGGHVTFVAGTRTSQPGSDGLFHSLALEANRMHYYRITSQGTTIFTCDPNANCIQTSNPPFGNTFAEPAPFNPSAPYNYAWPTIRAGVDRNTWFIDPLTGIAVSMFSVPAPVNGGYTNGAVQCFVFVCAQPGTASFDAANNGNWTTGCAAIGGSNCVNSTANQDPLFIRLKPFCVIGGTVQAPGSSIACPQGQSTWTEPGIDETQYNTIDDIQAVIAAAISGSTTGMQFALTVDGVNPATDWQSQTLTTSSASYPYPATGAASGGTIITPGFPSTQYGTGAQATTFGYWFANQATARLTRPDMQPHTGIVTIGSGGSVTWSSGEPFRMSSVSVGSHLTLVVSSVNTDFRITAVNSPTSLTIASPPAAGTYNYIYQGFGLLIRKAAATTGNLTVGGASFSDWESAANVTPIDGLVDTCESTTVTDGNGIVGRLCSWLEGFAHAMYFIEEVSGKGRFLGLAESNGGCFSNTCAPGVTNGLNNFGQSTAVKALGSVFIPGTSSWVTSASDSGSNFVLIQGTYNPSGAGSCPNNYQEINIANCPSYPYNNNATYINATPKVGADGQDHTPATQAAAYNAAQRLLNPAIPPFDVTRFNIFFEEGPFDQANGSVGILFSTNSQDNAAWFAKFSPATVPYTLVAMGNSYSSYNCRFCPTHGSGSLAGFENISNNFILPVCSGVGCGEFDLRTNTNTDNSTTNACTGITDPNFASYNGTSNCFDLTLAGTDPCHITPNLGSEVSPMYGTCSWNSSYTHLSGVTVQVGDLLDDYPYSNNPNGEMFRVVAIPSPGVIRVLRAYATPSAGTGPLEGLFARASALVAHTAPWNLRMLCSSNSGSNGGQVWFNLNVDQTAQNGIVDYPSYITSHADWWTTGVWAEVNRYRVYPSLGAMVGSPNSFLANQFGPFNGTTAYTYAAGWEDSHAGVSRDPNNPFYTVDKNPLSSASAAVNTLWTQTATNVTGSLWHILAANVQNNGASWPSAIKNTPFVVWSGAYLLKDISGPSSIIDGTPAHNWQFCVVYLAGECFSGSAVGDVYVNVPQSGENGLCGPWDYFRNICASTMDATGAGLNQYSFGTNRLYDGTTTPWNGTNFTDGRTLRPLSHLFARYNFESVFSSAHGSFGGQWVFGHSDYYGGGLRSDLFIMKLPPITPSDNIARNQFVNLPVQVGATRNASAVTARVRFGYFENGSVNAFYCAYNRQEACIANPSGTLTNPYYFASDSGQSYTSCANGCVLTLPAIPGRVVYYVVDRLNSSNTVIETEDLQVARVP